MWIWWPSKVWTLKTEHLTRRFYAKIWYFTLKYPVTYKKWPSSLAFTCITWLHLTSLIITCIHRSTCIHLISLQFTAIHCNSLVFTCIHFVFNRRQLNSHASTSLLFTVFIAFTFIWLHSLLIILIPYHSLVFLGIHPHSLTFTCIHLNSIKFT